MHYNLSYCISSSRHEIFSNSRALQWSILDIRSPQHSANNFKQFLQRLNQRHFRLTRDVALYLHLVQLQNGAISSTIAILTKHLKQEDVHRTVHRYRLLYIYLWYSRPTPITPSSRYSRPRYVRNVHRHSSPNMRHSLKISSFFRMFYFTTPYCTLCFTRVQKLTHMNRYINYRAESADIDSDKFCVSNQLFTATKISMRSCSWCIRLHIGSVKRLSMTGQRFFVKNLIWV